MLFYSIPNSVQHLALLTEKPLMSTLTYFAEIDAASILPSNNNKQTTFIWMQVYGCMCVCLSNICAYIHRNVHSPISILMAAATARFYFIIYSSANFNQFSYIRARTVAISKINSHKRKGWMDGWIEGWLDGWM